MGSYLSYSSEEKTPSSIKKLPENFENLLTKKKKELKKVDTSKIKPAQTEWQKIITELRFKIAGDED